MTQEYIVRMPSDMPYEIKAELNAWYVESEPIVRCRDCDYGLYDGKTCCRIDPWFDEYWFEVEPDGFCAYGVRRDA